MKTAIHASSIFCGALAVLLILCSTAPLSQAQRNKARPPPTPTPHFYDEYPIRRASIKKVLDGTYTALSFLGQASTKQVRHSEKPNEIKSQQGNKIFTIYMSRQRDFLEHCQSTSYNKHERMSLVYNNYYPIG